MFEHTVHVIQQHVDTCIDISLVKNILLDFTVCLLSFSYNLHILYI